MAMWRCSIRESALPDARASLGPLADETFVVEADSPGEAVIKVTARIDERRSLTTLPPDLFDDWLQIEAAD